MGLVLGGWLISIGFPRWQGWSDAVSSSTLSSSTAPSSPPT
jgi:hypothetical protein